MFYDPRSEPHGLAHSPITSLAMPRPIGWISSQSKEGVTNLAPYSFFNMVGGNPPFVMFSSLGRKDSQKNIEATGEFVVNMAVAALQDAVNTSAAQVGPDVDEFELAGLEKAACKNIAVPRVAASPIAMECRLNQVIPLLSADGKKNDSEVIIGEVVGVHIADDVIVEGKIDPGLVKPLSRLGYLDYAIVDEVFQIVRPTT